MNQQFKNRLVGVTILVACVIIFLPSLIDGKKEFIVDEYIAIPIKPETKAHTQSIPKAEKTQVIANNGVVDFEPVVEDKWQVEEIAAPITLQTSTDKKEKKAVKEKSKVVATPKKPSSKITSSKKTPKAVPTNAWTIQLGAFKNKKNINALLRRLKKSGYQAHTVPRDVIDGQLTRIFVGPDVSKSKLKKQIPKLKKLTKLNGRLVKFDAVNP